MKETIQRSEIGQQIDNVEKEDEEWFSQAEEERKSNIPVFVEDIKSPPRRQNLDSLNKSLYSPAVSAVMELSQRGGINLSSGGFKHSSF